MGKLIVTEFMTLGGVAQAPGGRDEDRDSGFTHGGWQAPLLDQDSGNAMFEQASHMDALLLGRKTYEIFASYWPTAPDEIPFTALLNDVPKYVASRTLSEPLDWKGSTLVAGDLTAGITGLKDRLEAIHVIGSLDLVQSLLRSDLVDRLSLWVYPLLLGTGKAGLRWRHGANGTAPHRVRQLPKWDRAPHVRQRRRADLRGHGIRRGGAAAPVRALRRAHPGLRSAA
jgi:dihydrofolate reductase